MGRNHFEKRRKCCVTAFSSFPTLFSKALFFNLLFDYGLKYCSSSQSFVLTIKVKRKSIGFAAGLQVGDLCIRWWGSFPYTSYLSFLSTFICLFQHHFSFTVAASTLIHALLVFLGWKHFAIDKFSLCPRTAALSSDSSILGPSCFLLIHNYVVTNLCCVSAILS